MKKISIILLAMMAGTSAFAQQAFKSKTTIGKQQGSHREKSRQFTNQLIRSQSNTQAKSTATYQRMIGFTDYGLNQQNQIVIYDSASMSYTGMRGSQFDFNTMSIGYFDPVFSPMMPENQLLFKADQFNIYMNNQSSSLAAGYTFTYNNDENVTEAYLADYQGGDDERILITYNGLYPVLVNYLVENGSNWDTTYRRFFTYDTNNMLLEDSVMENNNNVWSIYQKYEYTYDMNGNIISLVTHGMDMNNMYMPLYKDDYTYDNNDRMILDEYSEYDQSQTAMVLSSKDTFEYTTGVDFYTKDTYYMWDDVNSVWEPVAYMEKTLNTQMLPETATVYQWNGSAWEDYYFDAYVYNNFGNVIHDSLWTYTNQVLDEDPAYIGHFYYQDYWDLGVKSTAQLPSVRVYPNPATDVLNITSSATALNLNIVNAIGQTVKTARSSGNARLSISDLAPGTYWISVTDNSGNRLHTQAIVKQ